MEFDTITIVLIIVGVLTWLIVILGIARFAKFYIDFTKISKDLNNNLIDNTNVLRKINSASLEMLFEQRHACKLTAQLLEQFNGAEIIDEIIPAREVPDAETTEGE